MEVIQQTIASLGSPDAIRVVLSLSSTQQVRHVERSRVISTRGLPGHVSVFPAGICARPFRPFRGLN